MRGSGGGRKEGDGIMEEQGDETGEQHRRRKEGRKRSEGDERLRFCSNGVRNEPDGGRTGQEGALLPTSCPAWALVWPPFVVLVEGAVNQQLVW